MTRNAWKATQAFLDKLQQELVTDQDKYPCLSKDNLFSQVSISTIAWIQTPYLSALSNERRNMDVATENLGSILGVRQIIATKNDNTLFLGPFSAFDHLQYTKKEGQDTGRGHGNYTIGDIQLCIGVGTGGVRVTGGMCPPPSFQSVPAHSICPALILLKNCVPPNQKVFPMPLFCLRVLPFLPCIFVHEDQQNDLL